MSRFLSVVASVEAVYVSTRGVPWKPFASNQMGSASDPKTSWIRAKGKFTTLVTT
ncbi:hypothetical protein SAMN04487968_10943 [Nocardioides terrae]|uniref:Uncharacterized protein n=1 Tax=Nocardioides terrae TaxID=574651 RepID=A0A1I1L2C8_9ACTN|nr:hypothetical protein SAMN04487968_10943 [Nocardioides terrae]